MNRLYVGLLIPLLVLAARGPRWVLDTHAVGVPEMWTRRSAPAESAYSAVGFRFSSTDEIVLSFLQRRGQNELAKRGESRNSAAAFIVLSLAKADGTVLKKSEWPVTGESDLLSQLSRGSRIEPLASGGYIAIINGHLQVLDPSLKVQRDRPLDSPREHWLYELVPSRSGPLFAVVQRYNKFTEAVEVIDSRTLVTEARWEIPNVGLADIWEDRLLAIREGRRTDAHLEEKHVTGDWLDLGLRTGDLENAWYTADGAIIAASHRPTSLRCCDCWSVFSGSNQDGPSICRSNDERITSLMPARRAPILAAAVYKGGGVRAALDRDGVSRVVVYDLGTRTQLLTTPAREGMIGYAISSDGRFVAVLTKKRIEMYAVP